MTVDRAGNPWRVYPNGKMLCAQSRPYHWAYDAQNNDTDNACDCVNRKGETIAEFTMRFDRENV